MALLASLATIPVSFLDFSVFLVTASIPFFAFLQSATTSASFDYSFRDWLPHGSLPGSCVESLDYSGFVGSPLTNPCSEAGTFAIGMAQWRNRRGRQMPATGYVFACLLKNFETCQNTSDSFSKHLNSLSKCFKKAI